MLYIVTGANGTGKTLNTLKWVREQQLKENRPVAYNGRFEAVEGGELSSWKKIDAEKWQDEPDGTIFLLDECHNDFPVRGNTATVPEHVRMLGEHRKRGFDFYLITQHPSNIDKFIRKLVGAPGWHRHLKRTAGIDMVSLLQWDHANEQCERPGSGRTGQVTMVPFPKEVYGWYRSASLHTGKKKIPRQVWVFLICMLLIPLLIYFTYKRLMPKPPPPAAAVAGSPLVPGMAPGSPAPAKAAAMTRAEFMTAQAPRIEGLPHTAPVYDEMTKPTRVPMPAACISWEKRGCHCFTQDGTKLATTQEICKEIAAHGFFEAFPRERNSNAGTGQAPGAIPMQRMTQAPPSLPAVYGGRSMAPPDAPTGSASTDHAADLSMYAYAAGQRNPAR